MDPCKVCGGTDLNLVDGFYYCVECGTQDVNVQETVVEHTVVADGTFALFTVRKFTTVAKDGIEMSGEWHKWHIFNFILAGLTDELIALGAKPTIKMKVLWVWTRYIKLFQVKDDLQSKSQLDIDDEEDTIKSKDHDDKEDSGNDDLNAESNCKSKKNKPATFCWDIKNMSKVLLLTILYVALNLDRSDIQLYHLFRFLKEGRLSLNNCMKFVPKELNIKAVKNWKNFIFCSEIFNPVAVRSLAMTCFKRLKLGLPLVPNLRKLVYNYIQDLCLPEDIANLVISLMHYVPINFLDIDSHTQKNLVRIPDFEGVCMSYILVALKMCFGLDDDYEIRLSQEVDKINEEEVYLKSYKLGMVSEPCDRLFSFKEWCQHLQLRKLILCKYYLPIASQLNVIPDDYVFMEHLEKRNHIEIKLSDDVTMDILNKIRPGKETEMSHVIPKDEFPVSLTPITTYVDVIAKYVHDPELRLLLCEDFTQYSVKYVLEDFKLPGRTNDQDKLIVGVNESRKTFNNRVIGTLKTTEGDKTIVYIRNCENKNWLKTKPPTADHVKRDNESDKESDHGYDSNLENIVQENLENDVITNNEKIYPEDKKLEVIEVIDNKKSIFDDNFKDIGSTLCDEGHITIKEEIMDNHFDIDTRSNISVRDSKMNSFDDVDREEVESLQFNPDTFNREEIISKLIEQARILYKIPFPKENTVKEPRKRKIGLVNEGDSPNKPKKKRMEDRRKPGEAKTDVDKLIAAYYNNMQSCVFNEISERVKSLVENIDKHRNLDTSEVLDNTNTINNQNDLNDSVLSNPVDNEKSIAEIDVNHEAKDISDKKPDEIDSNVPNTDDVTLNDSLESEIVDELSKNDPNFDEKDHDIKQLYVKLGDISNATDISYLDIEDSPEIDKIIQKKIDEYANIDKYAVTKSVGKIHAITDDNSSDSEDDIPLNLLKESRTIDQEKEERKKEVIEPLIRKPLNVQEFKYWVRHYRSRCVIRSADIAKKFDFELIENLPVSFVLVIRECASILGCSLFTLYKNMQNIEEMLIT